MSRISVSTGVYIDIDLIFHESSGSEIALDYRDFVKVGSVNLSTKVQYLTHVPENPVGSFRVKETPNEVKEIVEEAKAEYNRLSEVLYVAEKQK